MIDGRCHGIGFASFVESSAGGLKEQARIRLDRNGTLDVFVGSTSSGQGHETVFAQVCADALHLPLDRIRIICASTDELEEGFGTWHSRSAVMSGNAVAHHGAGVHRAAQVGRVGLFRQAERRARVARGPFLPQRHRREREPGSAGGLRGGPRRDRRCDRDVRLHRGEAVQLRHPRGPRGGRSAHRRGRAGRLHRHRGYRPRAQSAGRARPGAGRDRAGARRHVPGAPAATTRTGSC